jgi:hypothetical protein
MTLHGGFRMMFLGKRHGGAVMERFLQRQAGRILGSLSEFDRVLFRGLLHSIGYVQGRDWLLGS